MGTLKFAPKMTTTYPKLKVTYFDMPGRAQNARLALFIAGIPFEDERISQEEWPALKPTLPFQQMPVLTVDGKIFAQSHAIDRYVGTLTGLYPMNNPLDALRVDEIVDFYDDMVGVLRPSFYEQDPDKKKSLREELAREGLPRVFSMLEARLASYPSKGPWYLDQISLADLTVYNGMLMFTTGFLDHIPTDICDKYTRWNQIYEAVRTHPKIVEWNAAHDGNCD